MLRISVIALFVFTCGFSTAKAQVTIQGRITPHPDWRNMVYLLYMSNSEGVFSGHDGLVVDSTVIAPDGTFSFVGKPFSQGIYRLNVQQVGNPAMAAMFVGALYDNFLHFVVSNSEETILIEAQANALFWSYHMPSASEANLQIKRGIAALEPVHQTMISLEAEVNEVQQRGNTSELQSVVAKWMPIVKTKFLEGIDQIRPLIAETQNVHVAIVLINYHNQGEPNLMAHEKFWEEQLDRLEKLDPNNVFLLKMRAKLIKEKTFLPIGAIAPEIALPNLRDEVTRLSEVRKRLVIIDFWASWCGPCIQESKNVIQPLYKTWKDKGLEVYAVSIDKDKKAWQGAISKHGYGSWINVVDATAGKVVKPLYDFTGIPTIYLVDENMNIVAKNLRGPMLTDFVEQYLGR